MPIYEYVCAKCGHEWDAIEKVSARPQTTCPECGKRSASRKVSAAAFHLKGSGWYVTDYKKSGGEAKAEGSDGSKGEPDSKAETKAESKADAKADTRTDTKAESKTGKTEATPTRSSISVPGAKPGGASKGKPAKSGRKKGRAA